MRLPLRWLSEYVDVTIPAQELAERLTMAGLEVAATAATGGDWDRISVAQVVDIARHPRADRLVLATVDLGDGERQTVVCGAPNVALGQKVAFARQGAELIDGHTGRAAVLQPAVIRGVESASMICSREGAGPVGSPRRDPGPAGRCARRPAAGFLSERYHLRPRPQAQPARHHVGAWGGTRGGRPYRRPGPGAFSGLSGGR